MPTKQKNISKLNLHISYCGDVDLDPRWNSENGSSAFSRLYLIYEGSGYLRTENETIWMKPGYAYLIPSKLKHSYGCTALRKVFFKFRLSVPPETEDILSPVNKILQLPYDSSDLTDFQTCYNSNLCAETALVHSLIYKYVFRMLSENGAEPISLHRHSNLVKKAIAYIDSNTSASMTVRSISDHLLVSESKLRSSFQAETGISIGHYIDNAVLAKAKQLLETPSLSIAQISARLGFYDQFYFARRFKKHYNMTPSAYRRSKQDPGF